MKKFFVFIVFLFSYSLSALAAEVKMDSVVLLQPNHVYEERNISVEGLSNLIIVIVDETRQVLKKETLAASSGFIVLALRSNGQLNAWLDIQPELFQNVENNVIQKIRQQQGPAFTHGLLVLAVEISINGGSAHRDKEPMPKAWQEALRSFSAPVDTEALVKHIWPE